MNAPVKFDHQPGLRALLMLDDVPAGHFTHRVPDDAFEPHLHFGEFAVIDLSDRQPVAGELFLVAYLDTHSHNRIKPTLCQPYRRDDGWYLRHEAAPTSRAEYEMRLRSGGMRTVEGSFNDDYLSSKLIGRVVGIFTPAVEHAR